MVRLKRLGLLALLIAIIVSIFTQPRHLIKNLITGRIRDARVKRLRYAIAAAGTRVTASTPLQRFLVKKIGVSLPTLRGVLAAIIPQLAMTTQPTEPDGDRDGGGEGGMITEGGDLPDIPVDSASNKIPPKPNDDQSETAVTDHDTVADNDPPETNSHTTSHDTTDLTGSGLICDGGDEPTVADAAQSALDMRPLFSGIGGMWPPDLEAPKLGGPNDGSEGGGSTLVDRELQERNIGPGANTLSSIPVPALVENPTVPATPERPGFMVPASDETIDELRANTRQHPIIRAS